MISTDELGKLPHVRVARNLAKESLLPGVGLGHSHPHRVVPHDEAHAYFARKECSVRLYTYVFALFDGVDVVRVSGVGTDPVLLLPELRENEKSFA